MTLLSVSVDGDMQLERVGDAEDIDVKYRGKDNNMRPQFLELPFILP